MYDRAKVDAYVTELLAAPAPFESAATLALVRAAVLTIKLAGVGPSHVLVLAPELELAD